LARLSEGEYNFAEERKGIKQKPHTKFD
jgi:hypothetical protein